MFNFIKGSVVDNLPNQYLAILGDARLYIALTCFMLLFDYMILKTPIIEIRGLYQQLFQLENEMENKQSQVLSLQDSQKKLVDFVKQKQVQLKPFFTPGNLSDILEEIAKVAMTRGLVVELIAPLPEIKHDFYSNYPIKIIVTGQYASLILFLTHLTRLPQMLTIDDFELAVKNETLSADRESLLEMKMKTSAYRPKRHIKLAVAS